MPSDELLGNQERVPEVLALAAEFERNQNEQPRFQTRLWQSTLFVIVVWSTTLLLRRHRARTWYWLWAVASLKFLIPFSVLAALGETLSWRSVSQDIAPSSLLSVDTVFTPVVVSPIPVSSAPLPSVLPYLIMVVWTIGVTAVLLSWVRQWKAVKAAVRRATPVNLQIQFEMEGLTVMCSPSMLEPAVVGVRHPVLLLPNGIVERLHPTQLRALMVHEWSHARYHDNLFAMIHMFVEAVFWFHPVVWWIETRLVDERERACDEDVLRSGSDAHDYAEGILEVCKFSLESPAVCVSGVSGSNLRQRVEAIMRHEVGRPMTITGRVALTGAALALVLGPIVAGSLHARPAQATTISLTTNGRVFEAASVKPNATGRGPLGVFPGGTFTAPNVDVRTLIRAAYGLEPYEVVGGPSWIDSARFEVNAKTGGTIAIDDVRSMLKSLLADRFKLAVHIERRTLPIYSLFVSNGNAARHKGLRASAAECAPVTLPAGVPMPPPPPSGAAQVVPVMTGVRFRCPSIVFPGHVSARQITPSEFASRLTQFVGRPVIDSTGLNGEFDIDLVYSPEGPGPIPPPDAPSIFTAIQEQLGLKLQSGEAPINVLVVDRVEEPSPN